MKSYWYKTIGVIFIGLMIFSTFELRHLKTQYSLDQFYPSQHHLLLGHEKIAHTFRLQKESPYLHVIELEEGSWLKPRNIQSLKNLTMRIEQRDDVKSITTLTKIEGTSESADQLTIGNLFDRSPAKSWGAEMIQNPLIYPLLITKDFSATLLIIEPKIKDQTKLMAFEDEIKEDLQKSFPEAKIHSSGIPMLQTRLSALISEELGLFLIGTSFIFCLVFYFIFAHWSAIACAFLSLLSSNVFTLALLSFSKIPMNAILVTLPVIVSVSIMSLLIHSLHLWAQRRKEVPFQERVSLALITLKEIWLPNTLGIITTALGFFALAPSSIPIISEYGLVVAALLVFVALLNQVMMLLFLPWVQPHMRNWLNRPAEWALQGIKHPLRFLFPATSLFVGTLFVLPALNFSPRLFDDLPKTDSVRSSTEWIDQSFGGTLGYDLMLEAGQSNWRKPAQLLKLKTLVNEIRKIPGVGFALSVPDFLPAAESESALAETLFLFSMAEKNPIAQFMTEDGKTIRLALRLRDLPSDFISNTKSQVIKTVREEFPGIGITEGGITSYAHEINNEVSKQLIYDFWQPLALIGLFLVFMFRSFRWAILSCLPNFIPPAALITAMAISNVAIKPGIALIFSIALGFAFNNTLYILSRLKECGDLNKALLQEGNPCLFESLIMFTGFALFIFSDFTMNQTFGGFMLLSIMAGFAADLFCLPALLKVFPSLYKKNEKITLKPATLAVIATLTFSTVVNAAESAQDILKKSQAKLDAKDDQAKVEMKIIEENGEIKTRTINLQTLRENGFSVLARIESPADIKNMAFLGNVDTEGNEMQWIYLPSSGQVRRLVTGESKAGLLGSEVSPEDLNSEAIKSASVKLLKSDAKFHMIEIIPEKGKSDYSKVVSKISKSDYLPQETQYFVSGKLKKTVNFKDYKKIGPVWRAHALVVKNHLNKRGTEILLSDVKVNAGLEKDDFSQSSLKDN